jgi:hypothetical protein
MITDREVQGPGKARWYDNLEEAQVYADAKREKGHIVRFCEENNYVWVSNSYKKHGLRARFVELGYDTLAV